jgi:hypothetical protein
MMEVNGYTIEPGADLRDAVMAATLLEGLKL